MAAKKTAKVHISSQFEGRTIEQTVTADVYEKGSSTYVQYQETGSGMGRTMTTLKLNPEQIKITRRGDVEAEQLFIPGRKQYGFYRTPQGSLKLQMLTRSVEVRWRDGFALWDYDLFVSGEFAGRYQIHVEIREEQ